MRILELKNLKKTFGATRALDGVNMDVEKGEVHALIGENGAGKSTLMNVISGAVRADSGSLILNGYNYAPANTLDARRKGIAIIHQELTLAQHLTVAENILMGIEKARFGWLDRNRLRTEASNILYRFGHERIDSDAVVATLSPAEQQIVEICRAISFNSELVLMDEPTSSLSRPDVQRLFQQITTLKTVGISIIYISHFIEEIREIADSFTVIRDGKSVATGKIADVTDEFLISKMVGRSIDDLFDRKVSDVTEDVVLKVEGLSAPPLVENASFELRKGEVFGIAGLMGSGRSDLLRAIFGLQNAGSGTISVTGRPPVGSGHSPGRSISKGLGYLSEDRKREGLGLSLSVADNTTVTRLEACSRHGWLNRHQQSEQTTVLMEELAIKAAGPFQAVKELSGGNQQKVAFARLVHQDADILLLDEPTRGIDIGSKAQIYRAIAGLARNGKAILVVSSYLPELFGTCDRLAVMNRGRMSPAKLIHEWTPESVMETAISGGSN